MPCTMCRLKAAEEALMIRGSINWPNNGSLARWFNVCCRWWWWWRRSNRHFSATRFMILLWSPESPPFHLKSICYPLLFCIELIWMSFFGARHFTDSNSGDIAHSISNSSSLCFSADGMKAKNPISGNMNIERPAHRNDASCEHFDIIYDRPAGNQKQHEIDRHRVAFLPPFVPEWEIVGHVEERIPFQFKVSRAAHTSQSIQMYLIANSCNVLS